jgi:hypothetical protein
MVYTTEEEDLTFRAQAVYHDVNTRSVAWASFVIEGTAPGDQFGWQVRRAGDLNDDGIDDIPRGARWPRRLRSSWHRRW